MAGISVTFPPFLQFFLKFVPFFPPFGSLEEVFRLLIPMSAFSWGLRGGPHSSLFHECSCWIFL